MAAERAIDVAFFDIGGTLGEYDPATGTLTPYPGVRGLLKSLREVVNLRVGVITTLGPSLSNAEALALLGDAQLAEFLDPDGFVSDHDAGVAKPRIEIYQAAAERVGVPPGRCLYVGENLGEVLGAIAAGMRAVLTPVRPAPA